jgi:hypothetical protein
MLLAVEVEVHTQQLVRELVATQIFKAAQAAEEEDTHQAAAAEQEDQDKVGLGQVLKYFSTEDMEMKVVTVQ